MNAPVTALLHVCEPGYDLGSLMIAGAVAFVLGIAAVVVRRRATDQDDFPEVDPYEREFAQREKGRPHG